MTGLKDRIVGFLAGQDEALNALGGGSDRETISGTVGRACGAAGGKPRAWGPPLRTMIEIMPWFGPGHCAKYAALEAARRNAFHHPG
jgi:hypothetical protein